MVDSKKPSSNLGLARDPAVPVRFRCKVGGEWKSLDSFSTSQQKLIHRQLAAGGRIDAANSGMACRDHSAITRIELRCDVCDLIKPGEEFSKNAKKNGESVCMRCIAWGETQEPEVNPAPLETGHLSIEEDNLEVWQQSYVESTDFFPGNDMPQAPITELSSLGLADHEVLGQVGAGSSSHSGSAAEHIAALIRGTSSSAVSGSTSHIGRQSDIASVASLPPHLRGNKPPGSDSTYSETSSVGGFEGLRAPSVSGSESVAYSAASIPPHLRSRVSAAHPGAAGQGRGPGSVSTATTLREARAARELEQENRKVPFNAWGPDGKHYKGAKVPTVPSSADEDSESAAESTDSNANQWQTSHPKTKWAKKPRGRDNWGKAPRLSAAELRKTEPFAHVSARHIDPDVDRQRRMQYCQSEDSDF